MKITKALVQKIFLEFQSMVKAKEKQDAGVINSRIKLEDGKNLLLSVRSQVTQSGIYYTAFKIGEKELGFVDYIPDEPNEAIFEIVVGLINHIHSNPDYSEEELLSELENMLHGLTSSTIYQSVLGLSVQYHSDTFDHRLLISETLTNRSIYALEEAVEVSAFSNTSSLKMLTSPDVLIDRVNRIFADYILSAISDPDVSVEIE